MKCQPRLKIHSYSCKRMNSLYNSINPIMQATNGAEVVDTILKVFGMMVPRSDTMLRIRWQPPCHNSYTTNPSVWKQCFQLSLDEVALKAYDPIAIKQDWALNFGWLFPTRYTIDRLPSARLFFLTLKAQSFVLKHCTLADIAKTPAIRAAGNGSLIARINAEERTFCRVLTTNNS